MEQPNKIEKLKQLMELISNDTVTPKKLAEFVATLVKIVKDSKDSLDSTSQEVKDSLSNVINYLDVEHSKLLNTVSQETSKHEKSMMSKIEESMKDMKVMCEDLMMAKPVDGIDGIDGKDGVDGKDGSPDTAKEIKDKLETLKDNDRLDVSAIKGIDTLEKGISDRAIGILDSRTRFLINKGVKHDTTLSGSGTDADPLKVIGGSGGGIALTDLSAGTGLSYDNTTGVFTNSAPDQTVSITAGTNITSVTGAYPNFTINAATQGGSYTLPTASDTVLGGVKVGTGLAIDGSGVLSSTSGGGDMFKADNLSGLANYGTARTNLGLAIGTDVLAYRTFGTAANSATTDFAAALGADDNYVTDAEKTAIGTIGSKLDANTPITGATKTKITYDADGLVTAGADATTADIADSTNKRYVTDANLTVIGNTSGTNTGDNATNTTSNTYADGKVAQTITNGVTTSAPSQDAVYDALANKQPLATVLTNTTASFTTAQETKLSGIAAGAEVNVNADWNAVSGDAHILNKPTISGSNTGDQTSIVGISGTMAQFDTAVSDGNIVYQSQALGTPSSGNLANCTFPTLNQNTNGTAANLSGTPALPNGTTATTQSSNDNSTKLATTAYVDGKTSSPTIWTTMPGTPTRVSNTIFTVTGDVTSYVAKGMIIKWTESSTVRCAMVSIPSTYSNPNTTITIIGDTMASIDASSLKYCMLGAEVFSHLGKFSLAGNIGAVATDVANAMYAIEPLRLLGADLQVGFAGTTNSTTIDINIAGTTAFTTKPTLASTVAASPTPFTADTEKSITLNQRVSIDIDAIQTTNAVDLYVQLYVFPTRYLNLS